jgi:hypothetical protein
MANNLRLPGPFSVATPQLAGGLLLAVLAQTIGCVLLAVLDLPRGQGPQTGLGAAVGGGVAIAVSAVSIFAFAPWKPRSALAWQTIWLASTVIRLTVTPLILASVYFAALLPGGAIFLGGVAGYGLALTAESLVLARAAWIASSRAAEPRFDGSEPGSNATGG